MHQPTQCDRVDDWRECLETHFFGLNAERMAGSVPHGSASAVTLGSVRAFEVSGGPQVLRRSASIVRRDPAELLKICVLRRGHAVLTQNGAEIPFQPGQFVVYDMRRPYTLHFETDWISMVATFPVAAMGLSDASLEAAIERVHATSIGAGAALSCFINTVLAQGVSDVPIADERLGRAGIEMLSAVLNCEANRYDTRVDLRKQLERYAWRHLHDPDLSVARIAAVHHMSERTVQRLFASEPRGLAGLIRYWRLEGARAELASPTSAYRTIAAIAARWCFTDAPHFSRTFRDAYGVTAHEVRGGAQAVKAGRT